MKLIINTSTLKGTGVTQVAVSFINECSNFTENDYLVFLSPNVAANINCDSFPINFKFLIFGEKSLYGLKGLPDIIKMKRIEEKYNPDAVFSVFGPSLWRPKAPHLQGYAYPHYVYPELPIFSQMSCRERISNQIRKIVHMTQLKRNGDYYVCETEDVSNRLHDLYHIDKDKVFTVSNTANSYFQNYKRDKPHKKDNSVFKFYCLCSPMPHKNLYVLNRIIPLLRDKTTKKILFYVTINNDAYYRLFSNEVRNFVVNVGPLKVSECPHFVDSCDALFLPTLLECFSASYPEAMIMGKPILTSDFPFATTVCKDAALYFDPYNAQDIANKIIRFVQDDHLYEDLAKKGELRFHSFLSPKERAEQYLDICKNISCLK